MTAPGGSPSPALRRDTRSTGRRDVGNIHGPDLVRTRDLYAAQQIGIDLVATLRLRCARSAIERLYPHPPHQRFDMPAADLAHLGSQQARSWPCRQEERSRKWDRLASAETGVPYRANRVPRRTLRGHDAFQRTQVPGVAERAAQRE